jgi:hypothetical protein
MAFGRRKNESSSTDPREAAARLPKTAPTRSERLAVPENPHSRQYSALSGGYTNREEKPVPGTPQNRARRW